MSATTPTTLADNLAPLRPARRTSRLRNPLVIGGATIILLMIAFCIVYPMVSAWGPTKPTLKEGKFSPPSIEHPLGTDALDQTDDECVAHHEGAPRVGHPCGPAIWEAVEALELAASVRARAPIGGSLAPIAGLTACEGLRVASDPIPRDVAPDPSLPVLILGATRDADRPYAWQQQGA